MSAQEKYPGVFITFEGGEGAGKSTHIRFLAAALQAEGYEVLCLREPGGTVIGEVLRDVVLNPDFEAMSFETELLIYEAARAQLMEEVIRPALERGAVVLCDRFSDSTIAYQAFGRGIDRKTVEKLNHFATGGIKPDRTLVLMPPDADSGLERATHRNGADRLEMAGSDFHHRVNQAFKRMVEEDPDRMRLVDSSQTKSQTATAVFDALGDVFGWVGASRKPASFFASLDKPKEEV